MVRIPARLSDRELEAALTAPGVPLLPKVRKPRWAFFQGGEWKEEWPTGSPRPELVRLQLEIDEIPDPIEAIFYVPPVSEPQATPPETQTSQAPKTTTSPATTPGK